MSHQPQGAWPSPPSDFESAQTLPAKQGIGGFKDSIQSCKKGTFAKHNPSPKKKGRRWFRILKRGSLVATKRAYREKGVKKLSFEAGCLRLSDEGILELLLLISRHGTRTFLIEQITKKLLEKLPSSVQKTVEQFSSAPSNPFLGQLSSHFFIEVRSALEISEEAKRSLNNKQLSVEDQLGIIQKMVNSREAKRGDVYTYMIALEFCSLFERLYVKTKERIVRSFFEHQKRGFWSEYINEAMSISGNPIKLEELFRRYGENQRGNFETKQGIQAALQGLGAKNRGALEKVQLDYYYTSSLFKRAFAKFAKSVEKNPLDLLPIIDRAFLFRD